MAKRLPAFVEPMLAKRGGPFDSDQHLFEVKWDGFRALTFVDEDGFRFLSRNRNDLAPDYPELGFLAGLPKGVLIDGEIVVLTDGKPDFEAQLSRMRRSGTSDMGLAAKMPASYVAFDLLYEGFEEIMSSDLVARRERLRAIVEAAGHGRLVFSDGIVGAGCTLFEKVTEQGLEGIVAKRLDSRYLPGKRADAWTKIKRSERVHCAIIGFLPAGEKDLKSLLLATNDEARGLYFCGRVGSGLGRERRAELNSLLRGRIRSEPIVPCQESGIWVEPGIYCTVTYVEKTKSGLLRAPVFDALVRE